MVVYLGYAVPLPWLFILGMHLGVLRLMRMGLGMWLAYSSKQSGTRRALVMHGEGARKCSHFWGVFSKNRFGQLPP